MGSICLLCTLFLLLLPGVQAATTKQTSETTATTAFITTLPSATVPTFQPPSKPGEDSTPEEIEAYYKKTGTTCCHVQSSCEKCPNYYDASGIKYCCPNCKGYALVTNLLCTCYAATPFVATDVHCKVNSSTVVGGYRFIRPSYPPSASASLMLSAFLCLLMHALSISVIA